MEVQVEEGGGDDGVLTTTEIRRDHVQWRAAVYARLGTMARMVAEIQQHALLKFTEQEKRLRRMESLVRTLQARPLQGAVTTARGTTIQVGNLTAEGENVFRPAILSRNPKTLAVLWDEWCNGIGGNLPAKDFEPSQRGKKGVKANYSFRKPFWNIMERLLDKGVTVAEGLRSVDNVYAKYGSVTKQLKEMAKDERNGGHISLQGRRSIRIVG